MLSYQSLIKKELLNHVAGEKHCILAKLKAADVFLVVVKFWAR